MRGARRVRLLGAEYHEGLLDVIGFANLYEKDRDLSCLWVVAVNEKSSGRQVLAHAGPSYLFGAEAGRTHTECFMDSIPLELAPGEYLVELTFQDLAESGVVTSNLYAGRQVLVVD